MRVAFINDKFIEERDAVIGINDLALRRGFGIFDFFRTAGLTPLFIDDHLDRFYKSAEKIGLVIRYDKPKLIEICNELIGKNKIEGGGVRIILTGGYSLNSYTPADPNLVITNEPLKLVDEQTRTKGIKVISHNFQREFPEVKTLNYFTGVMMQKTAESENAFDVLYHDNGLVREFTRSNIFIVTHNNTVVTTSDQILKGVTRGNVIKLAIKKYNVVERDITLEELFYAKEVFMTGTTKRVLPIVQIDNRIIGDGKPGKISMELYNDFYDFEKTSIKA